MLSLFSTLRAIITSFKKASPFPSQDQPKTSHYLLSQHQEALHSGWCSFICTQKFTQRAWT